MKKTIFILSLIIALQMAATAQDRQIEAIKKIYAETNQRIKEAERAFARVKPKDDAADTDIFLTEVYFNKGKTAYPGTGPFRTETKFYFTLGSGAERYTGKLLKIVRTTRDLVEVRHEEWLFNPKGELIFYFDDPDAENTDPESAEIKIYFSGGKMIRFLVNDSAETNSPILRRKNEVVQEVLEEQKKLVNVFRNSM